MEENLDNSLNEEMLTLEKSSTPNTGTDNENGRQGKSTERNTQLEVSERGIRCFLD